MGSSFTAPLAPVGGGHCDHINAALGISPDLIQQQLKPLLDMDIHGLCEAYRRLAERCKECCRGTVNKGHPLTAKVASRDLEGLLGLPVQGVRLIVAHRASVPVVELLLLLVLMSKTHALAKPRFIFCVCEQDWHGDINFATFRAIVAALLNAVFFLSRRPRAEFPKLSSADVLARPLFAPHSPAMNKDSFVWLVSSEGPVWYLLRRFARDALDQHFLLTPWPVQQSGQESESSSESHSRRSSPQRSPTCTNPESVLPQHDEVRTQGSSPTPPPSLYVVPPRRQRPKSARSTPSRTHLCLMSYNPALAKKRSTSYRRSPSPNRFSASKSAPSDPSAEDRPRRKGYFQAVPSPREQQLAEELCRLQTHKDGILKKRGMSKKVQRCEEELKAQILQEQTDNRKRGEYRSQISQIRKGDVMLPATPRARLWTASREHAMRGGELPRGCSEPLTPSKLQDMLLSKLKRREQIERKEEPEVKTPTKTLEDALELANALPPSVARRLTVPVGQATTFSDDENSDDGSKSSKKSASSHSHSSKNTKNAAGSQFKKRDVLLAFELYRQNYWDDSASSAKTKEKTESATLRCRRDDDIEAILQEADKEYFSSHAAQDEKCKSTGLSLRQYLRTLFGHSTQSDLKQMFSWIEDSRTIQVDEGHARVESQKRQVEALRELIDLFDTIDKDSSGAVPLVAIEQFLCGELLTEREVREAQSQKDDYGLENVATCRVATYVDNIRELSRARFLTRLVEDREEWSVLVPDHERRWAGLQTRFSVKDYRMVEHMSQSRNKQLAITKVIGERMKKLAEFLDEERGACSDADSAEGSSGNPIEGIHGADLDIACTPEFNVAHVAGAGDGKQIRLVRLYWRYLLGSAVQQSLRDYEHVFNLRNDGKVDLVAFVCILAHDQVLRLVPKGEKPTPRGLRKIVYAFAT